MSAGQIQRTSLQLYRDCLRLVDHIAAKSAKGQQLRHILRGEFEKNRDVKDQDKIDQLKGNAIRGLSNYFLHESSSNDPRLKERMDAVKRNAINQLKEDKRGGSSEDQGQ
ncbi:unnamed protein product [Discosporangium mesarthrocarpum]